jgi:hypothetical protein
VIWQDTAYVVDGSGNEIDDMVLHQMSKELGRVPRLAAVYLDNTSVTRDGAARLFRSLGGNVRVELDEGQSYVSFRERR